MPDHRVADDKIEILLPGEVPRGDVIRRLESLSILMDSAFTIPGTNVRMGLDGLIGLVPVVGDIVTTAISSYILYEARRLGASKLTLARMAGNVAIDGVIGAIPIVGDMFDVAFRANRRNVRILREHLERTSRSPGRPR
jgi:hypothetical protein